jgi:hypothetical protein
LNCQQTLKALKDNCKNVLGHAPWARPRAKRGDALNFKISFFFFFFFLFHDCQVLILSTGS